MKRLPGILIIVLLLIFVVLFSIWVGGCEKQTIEVKVVDNGQLYKQEVERSHRIQDSLANVLSQSQHEKDSTNALNRQLNINIKNKERERDTVIYNIPLRNALEYERFLSEYYLRYHKP